MTRKDFLDYMEWVFRPCETLMKLAPDDRLDYSPAEGMFTLGQLLHHLAVSPGFYAQGLGTGDWRLRSMREILLSNRREKPVSGPEALEILQDSKRRVFEAIERLSDEDFQTKVIDSPMLGRQKIWRLGMQMAEHQLNHKEQLFLYLKLLGIRVHTGTLYTGSVPSERRRGSPA